jgi:FdhD protein
MTYFESSGRVNLPEEELETPSGLSPKMETLKYSGGAWQKSLLNLPREMSFVIYINKQELVTILCTPSKLNCLTLGYLFAEGILDDLKDVASMRVCEDDSLAEVTLTRTDFALPQKRILTSGCGGGVSLNAGDLGAKIVSDLVVSPDQLLALMKAMLQNAGLYNLSGGIHTSALAGPEEILVVGEDIGRHNTLDKILGECMLRKVATRDKILLTSGRISSEMLRKAAKMQTPILVSLTSPTERAVLLARDLDICLVGYVKGGHMTVYSEPERLGVPAGKLKIKGQTKE